jgi:alpha-L-fucosidase
MNSLTCLCFALIGAAILARCADVLADGPASPPLTDEQRSALKQVTDPVISEKLRLSDKDMDWWRDAKFGMFIHWGLYSIPGEGEWVQHNKNISNEEYAKLADEFKPAKFDADAWAAAAKSAGMKYMVMVTRHHDGFALWDSKTSVGNFTSMASAAHRDFVKEYVEAARRAGLAVGLYYSPLDWRLPGYFHPHELPESAQQLKAQTYGQIEELMSNYGKIDILWYDGGWLALKGTDADSAWLYEPIKLNTMARQHQPKLVINPRSGWEGDFACEEGGGEIKGPIRQKVWEKCLTLNMSSWGYNKHPNLMSFKQSITHLVNAVCRNGNALYNVGPDADGVIPQGQIDLLKKIGEWTGANGESIFNTRPGPFQPVDRIFGSTCHGDVVYLHILSWPDDELKLPALPVKITSAACLNGKPAVVHQTDAGITVAVAPADRDELDTVVKIQLEGSAQEIPWR